MARPHPTHAGSALLAAMLLVPLVLGAGRAFPADVPAPATAKAAIGAFTGLA
ncbi:MAG: hypothetical protein ACKOUM_06410 [Sphingopyxis sp.]